LKTGTSPNYNQSPFLNLKDMQESELPENWEDQKAKLKQKLGLHTNQNPITDETKKDNMLNDLQAKLGKTREEILKVLDNL